MQVGELVIRGTGGDDVMTAAIGDNSTDPIADNLVTEQVGADTFSVYELGNKTNRLIDGLLGTDTLDISAAGPQTIELTGPGTLDGWQGPYQAGDFDNINKLIGGPGSTLVGPDADTVWDVTGSDSGTITSGGLSMDFEGFGSLTGQSHDDRFVMHDGGELSGTVDGGGQQVDGDGDTLDYSNYTTDVTVNLLTGAVEKIDSLAAGTVGSSIENVFGGSGNDTITGDEDDNILRDGAWRSDVLSGNDGDDRFQLQPESERPALVPHDYLTGRQREQRGRLGRLLNLGHRRRR